MPEENSDQSQRENVDNANSDKPTQAKEGESEAEAQTCTYFLHNRGDSAVLLF